MHCVFHHEGRDVRVVVNKHGFAVVVDEKVLDWCRGRMEERIEVKVKARLGPEEKDDEAVRILSFVQHPRCTSTTSGALVHGPLVQAFATV